jgi:hypothetical protein
VYRAIEPEPLALPDAGSGTTRSWELIAPAPVNASPLSVLTFSDPLVFDDRARCYHVRAVRGMVESAPSPIRCFRPVDVFPPVTPTGLTAIVTEGAITLIWDPNIETDLGGYIVLRREAAGATLAQLTAIPITQTRYADTTVTPGVRYTYEVRAVDNRIPIPNASAPAGITETAR